MPDGPAGAAAEMRAGFSARRTIHDEAGAFRDGFNRRPFLFRHTLSDDPLFTTARLSRTAQTILEDGSRGGFSVSDAGSFGIGAGFGAGSAGDKVAETVDRLEGAKIWLKLSSVEKADPAYAERLGAIIREIAELTGQDLPNEITWSAMTVFMASPGIITPYHIDHESNFLLQVSGEKEVCLFDQDDPEILPQEEVEKFYVGDPVAARYKPDLQARGRVHRLAPGSAVHHPPLSPHWVRNGGDVSVSVSIGFCLRSWDRRAKVHQVNAMLRRIGLRPAQPGLSPMRDGLKRAGLELATKRDAVSREDVLFSGFARATAPLRLARAARRRLAG